MGAVRRAQSINRHVDYELRDKGLVEASIEVFAHIPRVCPARDVSKLHFARKSATPLVYPLREGSVSGIFVSGIQAYMSALCAIDGCSTPPQPWCRTDAEKLASWRHALLVGVVIYYCHHFAAALRNATMTPVPLIKTPRSLPPFYTVALSICQKRHVFRVPKSRLTPDQLCKRMSKRQKGLTAASMGYEQPKYREASASTSNTPTGSKGDG